MNSAVKRVAIIAAGLLAVGVVLAGIGFMLGGNQPIRLGPNGFEVGEKGLYTESFAKELNQFESIDADMSFSDIDLIPSDRYYIEGTFDSDIGMPDIKVENGKLTVADRDRDHFNVNLDLFGFDMNSEEKLAVKIYYPKNVTLKEVNIDCDASDLEYQGIRAKTLTLDLDFGKLNIKDLTADQVTLKMSSGDCDLRNIAADSLSVTNDLGQITLADATVKKLGIEADSGDVSITDTTADHSNIEMDLGKLISEGFHSKGTEVISSSGDVKLKGKLEGLTKIQSDLGKVTVDTELSREQYNYDLKVDLGQVYIDNEKTSSITAKNGADAANSLDIKADSGDIRVDFH